MHPELDRRERLEAREVMKSWEVTDRVCLKTTLTRRSFGVPITPPYHCHTTYTTAIPLYRNIINCVLGLHIYKYLSKKQKFIMQNLKLGQADAGCIACTITSYGMPQGETLAYWSVA